MQTLSAFVVQDIQLLHCGLRVKHVDFLKVVQQVLSLIGSEDAKREADKGPHVNHPIIAAVVFA